MTVEGKVFKAGPKLKASMAENTALTAAEIIAHPDQREELRTFRYGHVVGAGLPPAEIEDWQTQHPEHPLPADLKELLMRVNGVHLWADLDTLRAYFGILPLEEWQDVRQAGWAMMFETPPVGQLVLSYHDNGDYFLVLDTSRQTYVWYDLQDFDNPKQVGRTVEELLDFWWRETAWLGPRQSGEAG